MNRRIVIVSIFGGVLGLALVVALMLGAPQTLARSLAQSGAPALVSYQGYLTDELSQPISGTVDLQFELYAASSGGAALWSETQTGVTVGNGFFSTMLGSVTPLSASDFDATTRYLQVSVDTGGGFVDMPRQRLGSVPFALQAEEAKQATSADAAPWSGLTGIPADFADGVDDDTLEELFCGDGEVAVWDGDTDQWVCGAGGGGDENVIVVAKSGGDYTSVADALDSITGTGPDSRYLVWVAPGVYTETQLAHVPAYVHLQGAGPNATLITSGRSGSTPGPDAATVQLDDKGRVSDVNVVNQGTGTYGIAIYSALATRDTVVDNVVAEANGAGGTGHYAAYLNDSELVIQDSTLKASGATGFGTAVNAALGSVNFEGGFPQALIVNSVLLGGDNNKESCADNTGTGFGMQLSESSPNVRDSYVCGGHRGIAVYSNGHPVVQNANVEVSSNNSAYLFEISSAGSISLANTGVTYFSTRKITGTGTGLRCVHAYDNGTWQPRSDGTDSTTACN